MTFASKAKDEHDLYVGSAEGCVPTAPTTQHANHNDENAGLMSCRWTTTRNRFVNAEKAKVL